MADNNPLSPAQRNLRSPDCRGVELSESSQAVCNTFAEALMHFFDHEEDVAQQAIVLATIDRTVSVAAAQVEQVLEPLSQPDFSGASLNLGLANINLDGVPPRPGNNNGGSVSSDDPDSINDNGSDVTLTGGTAQHARPMALNFRPMALNFQIQSGLTPVLDAAFLSAARERFVTTIGPEIIMRDRNLADIDDVVRSQANALADMIFNTVFGQGKIHLHKLIAYHNNNDAEGIIVHAHNAAQDEENPYFIRELYSLTGRYYEAERHVKGGSSKLYAQFQMMLYALQICNKYYTIRDAANGSGNQDYRVALVRWLQREHGPLSQGVDFTTLLLEKLSSDMNMQKQEYTKIINQWCGVRALVEGLGDGIVLLLPHSLPERLRKTTVRRIHILNQRLIEELPGLQEFLAHLAQTILQPILQGERIGYTVRLGGGNLCLLESLEAVAVAPAQDA